MTVHSESDDRELLDGTDLSIGIVSYNAVDALLSCLRSIIDETSEIQFEIFVVDNAIFEGSPHVSFSITDRMHCLMNDLETEGVGTSRSPWLPLTWAPTLSWV